MTFERYSRREFLRVAALAGAALTVPGCAGARIASRAGRRRKPNFILILTDDQGYNDLGCFGSKLINTPNIDRMAAEGVKLTSFYTGAPICGPSRAALLTGCYSQRVDEVGQVKEKRPILVCPDKPQGLIRIACSQSNLVHRGLDDVVVSHQHRRIHIVAVGNPEI